MTKPYKRSGIQCCAVPTLKVFLKAASLFLSQKDPRDLVLHDASDMVKIQRRRRSLSASPSLAPLIVPMEARRRRRRSSGSIDNYDESSDTSEPTSPRVSCVGRIEIKRKCKTVKKKEEDRRRTKKKKLELSPTSKEENKGKGKALQAPYQLVHGEGDNEKWSPSGNESATPVAAPCLEKMRGFSSSRRRPLTDFLWEDEEKGVDGRNGGNYSGG